jgi:hypothetical protein
MSVNRAAWAFAIAVTAGCASSPAVPPATTAKVRDAIHACNAAVLLTTPATKVSGKEFTLSVSTHEEGEARCTDDTLQAIVDAKAGELCGQAPHRVMGGDGKVTISSDSGVDRQGFIDRDLTYSIQCGNAA